MTGHSGYNDPFSSSTSSIQYSLPSITSQQTLNNIVPPSHPTAVSVTSTPPPPMMNSNLLYPHTTNLNSPQNYNGSYNFNKRSQVKFTPKYKRKSQQRDPYDSDNESNHSRQSYRSQRDQHPLVLPSHSVSNKIEDEQPVPRREKYRDRGGIGLQNITEGDEQKQHEKNKSTLAELVGSKHLDALQMRDSHGGIMNLTKDGIFTPPPRAPIKQFEYINPTVMNEEEYENDIVKPHAGYNQGSTASNSKVQPMESKTEFVDANDEMADAASTTQNTMVSLLAGDDGLGAVINDELNLSSPPRRPVQRENSNNHLVPMKNNNNALPHLRDGDEDQSADEHEVNLHFSNNEDDLDAANTINNLYGDITKGPRLQKLSSFDDTRSVVSDFEDAEVWLKQENEANKKDKGKKHKHGLGRFGKIKVTCNNCYLWRHFTNKLEIDIENLTKRKMQLEQSINDAENNEQVTNLHYDELKEENERLKNKNNELKQQMIKQKQESTEQLIELRKETESQLLSKDKDYQNLMKQKNELEQRYNEQVTKTTEFEQEIEKYKADLHSMKLKHDRLDYDIVQERIALNLREKSIKNNLDEIKEKYMNLQKENKESLDELQSKTNEDEKYINELTEENGKYKLQISQLNEETKRLKQDLETVKTKETELITVNNEIEQKLKVNQTKLNDVESNLKSVQINEERWKNKYTEKEAEFQEFKEQKEKEKEKGEIDPEVLAVETEKKMQSLQLKYSELQSRNDEIGQKCEEYKNEAVELKTNLEDQSEKIKKLEDEVLEWKTKYTNLNEELVSKQNDLITKSIEYNNSLEKTQRLTTDITKYKEKNEQLITKLQKSQNDCIELNSKLSICMEENEVKLMETRTKLHNLEDELTEIKDENQRFLKMKEKSADQLHQREEQLKQSNAENDKLMDQNYELNEKLSKQIEKMDKYKNSLENINNKENENKEEMEAVTKKLQKATTERDKLLKKNVRLNNRIKSLQNENTGLQDSIHHLESIIDDTYGLAEDKDRKLNHLKRANNQTELSLQKLKSRMNKHNRQMASYRDIENAKISKTHRKMDQKLDMVRKAKANLQSENDQLHDEIKELKSQLNDLESTIEEKTMRFKSKVSKYESDISQITANNNKILSEKLEQEADLENTKEENNKLIIKFEELSAKYNKTFNEYNEYKLRNIKSQICHDIHGRQYLIELDIKDDQLYQFVDRCRNIFINTNKLTPKLIMQLIESCHKAITVFHQSKHKFNDFVSKTDSMLEKYDNLQKSILDKSPMFGPSSVIKLTAPEGIASPGRKGRSRANTSAMTSPTGSKSRHSYGYDDIDSHAIKGSKKRNKKGDKKGDKSVKIGKLNISKINKPVQVKPPPHHGAYGELYQLELKNVTNAKHDLNDIAEFYQKPLEYNKYQEDDNNDDDMEDKKYDDTEVEHNKEIDLDECPVTVIDYDRLLIDPSTERDRDEMIKNNEKFANAIKKFKASTKELRTLSAKTSVELDVAWHSYYLSSDIIRSRDNSFIDDDRKEDDNTNNDENEDEYDDVNSDLELDLEYIKLMKTVTRPGPLQKRFSII